MKFRSFFRRKLSLSILAIPFFCAPAIAKVTLAFDGSGLFSVLGIKVDNELYRAKFVTGSYNDVYDTGETYFTTPSTYQESAKFSFSLLSQVLAPSFGRSPSSGVPDWYRESALSVYRIAGCQTEAAHEHLPFSFCSLRTAYGTEGTQAKYTTAYAADQIFNSYHHELNPNDPIVTETALNNYLNNEPSSPSTTLRTLDYGDNKGRVWVKWSKQTPSAVPELDAAGLPLTIALMLCVGAFFRERRQQKLAA